MLSRNRILQLFSSAARYCYSTVVEENLQLKAMSERCYLVSPSDKIVGTASKKECHFIQTDGTLPLHRAFSVFLFNEHGHLLLQQRSAEKITYPNCFTNSCCSHPIADVEGEDDEVGHVGVKKAAQRRLHYELGIPPEALPLDKIKFITRIYYQHAGNGVWGEHEISYILFVKADLKVQPNPSEIANVQLVPRESIAQSVQSFPILTPWFQLIYESELLKQWWDNLNTLEKVIDHESIVKLSFN